MKTTRWLLAPAVAFAACGAATFGTRSAWDRFRSAVPVLECTALVDLGDQERGQVALAHFRVRNAGRGELKLEGFQTSCSCAAVVGRELDGQLARVNSVELSPGKEVELTARVVAGGPLGQAQHVQAFFRTNDPQQPLAKVDFVIPRVRGGCVAQPAAVVFGTLSPGALVRKVIDLHDNGSGNNVVRDVRSSQPERFTVRLLPLPRATKEPRSGAPGPLIARVEVTARSDTPGPLDGAIRFSFANEDGKADPIPVVGEVRGCARCWPSSLLLPRRCAGQTRYDGEVLILAPDEKAFEARIISCPTDVAASLRMVPGQPGRWRLQVRRVSRQGVKPAQPAMKAVRLRVVSGGRESVRDVPVLLAEDRS